jgi:hypothetical protein
MQQCSSRIHSFILDLDDITLKEMFTNKELLEMQEFGTTLLLRKFKAVVI